MYVCILMGMNSTKARDKAINLMNEEAKDLTVEQRFSGSGHQSRKSRDGGQVYEM